MYVPFDEMPKNSKVWLFPCSENLISENQSKILADIQVFVENWLSHQRIVKGSGTVLFGRIICLTADETDVDVSGCSLDSSTRFIHNLETQYSIHCTDRSHMIYQAQDGTVDSLDFRKITAAFEQGQIHEDTLVFNLQAKSVEELSSPWIPLKQTPYANFLPVER